MYIPTEERYEAIVELFEMDSGKVIPFAKSLGVSRKFVQNAINYIEDKKERPEEVKDWSPGRWEEVRTLPKEEREDFIIIFIDDKNV